MSSARDQKIHHPSKKTLRYRDTKDLRPRALPSKQTQRYRDSEDLRAKGLLLLDWDGTIIQLRNPDSVGVEFFGQARTEYLLKTALKYRIDIHIVTARPNNETTFHAIIDSLKALRLINTKNTEKFWRARIHCVIKDWYEWKKFDRGELDSEKIIPERKKKCIEAILTNSEYAYLSKADIQFYDDNEFNVQTIATLDRVTAIRADNESGAHLLNEMLDFIASKDTAPTNEQPAKAVEVSEEKATKHPTTAPSANAASIATPTAEPTENKQKEQVRLIKSFGENLNACLNAMYPKRSNWKEAAVTNAGGIKEIHKEIFGKSFNLLQLRNIHQIALKRIAKGYSACSSVLFHNRAPEVQKLYSIIEKLDAKSLQNIETVNHELVRFANDIQKEAEKKAVVVAKNKF